MARGKRSRKTRGGKKKCNKRNADSFKPKGKKVKFDLRTSSYIKERKARNEDLEARRQIAEKEKAKSRLSQIPAYDSSDCEDPMEALLASFSDYKKSEAISSESESSDEEFSEQSRNNIDEKEINEQPESSNREFYDHKERKQIKKIIENEVFELTKNKNIVIRIKEDEEDDETAQEDAGHLRDPFSIHLRNDLDDKFYEVVSTTPQKMETTTLSWPFGKFGNIIWKFKKDDETAQEDAQEDADHLRDPFSIHLRNDLDDKLYEVVSTTPQKMETTTLLWPKLGNIICEIPKPAIDASNNTDKLKKDKILDDEKQYASYGTVPNLIETINWDKLYIKRQIQENLIQANCNNMKDCPKSNAPALTPLQRELFSVINNYQDLYYPERTFSNADEIRFVYCLHVINHILKTRTKILHHNSKLTKSGGPIPDEYRDQGLVRPKVFIIVPFKHSCLKIVETLISILIGEDKGGSVVNKLRFMEDFTGNELRMPKKTPKPEDYELTFQGNIGDEFKIGIAVTKKTLKLYTKFSSSDIIISSPLGLRRLIGAEGEAERDYDFLASIELLIMDQIELVTMQNWDHLHYILKHLNLQPKKMYDTDIFRLRTWCLNGWTRYYRQTLIFSAMELSQISGALKKTCFNYAGRVRVVNPVEPGSIYDAVVTVPQMFYKFNASDPVRAIDSRMEFFLKKVLPKYKDPVYKNHTLIFVPSYYDFVLLRLRMMKEELSFAQICEYTMDAKIAKARDMFFHSDVHFLLYTERFHFYRRLKIKGIRHIIFYQLPIFPQFYSEICNLMQADYQNPHGGSKYNMSVTVLYNKFDCYELARIVGEKKAIKMINSKLKYHRFTYSNIYMI